MHLKIIFKSSSDAFGTFFRQSPVYLYNLPPNIKNPCRQGANGRIHCDEQNCRKDKNGEQECRSRVHTFQATPNGMISVEEQVTIEENVSKIRAQWSLRPGTNSVKVLKFTCDMSVERNF